MQQTQITELNAFSGGMNNVAAPYLIRKDESVVLTNVNLRRGSMESVPRLVRKQDVGYMYFYQFGNHLLQYGSWRANVVWDNKLYWTDGVITGKVLYDGTELPLGIDTPVQKLEQKLTPVPPPILDQDVYNNLIWSSAGTVTPIEDDDGNVIPGEFKVSDPGGTDVGGRAVHFTLTSAVQAKDGYVIFYATVESGNLSFVQYSTGLVWASLPDGPHTVKNGRNVIYVGEFHRPDIMLIPTSTDPASVIEYRDVSTFVTEESAGVHTGNFKYTYTFYDSEHGVESAPAPLSLYSEPKTQNIELTGFDPLPSNADKYRIYRVGGYLPYFQRVDDYEPAEGTPVDEYKFIDDLDDTQIDGSELLTLETGKPPDQIAYFVEMSGRMYGAVDNILYYSSLGNPDNWYINDFFQMKGKIKGLAATPGGLLVMGDYYTNILKGTQPSNFVLRLLSDKIGCREASSIAYIDTTAVWLSYHGVVMSDGFAIRQLTADRIEDISGLNPTGAEVINNIYFLSYKPILTPDDELYPNDDLFPDGVVGTGGVEQGIITLDFKRGNGFAYKVYTFDQVQYIDVLDGKIGVIHGDPEVPGFPDCNETGFPDCWDFFACSGMELAYLHAFPQDQLELKHLAEMEYMSPLLVDGSTAMLKEYDKVRVIYRGIFDLKIYFDNDREVQSQHFESPGERGLDFTETVIGIPNNDNKAYSIRFHITGRGTIKGIQYSYKFRENMP